MIRGLFCCLLSVVAGFSFAQTNEKFDVQNLAERVGSLSIVPFFNASGDSFWYVFTDSTDNTQYYGYSLEKGKYPLYDKKAIKQLLNEKGISSNLVFYRPKFDDDKLVADIFVSGQEFRYDSSQNSLLLATSSNDDRLPYNKGSFHSRFTVFVKDCNLFVKDESNGLTKQLTNDGVPGYAYSSTDLYWLKGTDWFYLLRLDNRKVRDFTVVNSLGSGLDIAPHALSYKYELPGDTAVTKYELYIGNARSGEIRHIDSSKWKDQQLELIHSSELNDRVVFVRKKRSRDQLEVCTVDTAQFAITVVADEISKPIINYDMFNCRPIDNGKLFLLWSDRADWGHYYLYAKDGRLLRQVTSGAWTAGKILYVDEGQHELYCYGYGREKDIDPNFPLLYKINYLTGETVLVTPENASHSVFISPNGKLIVDTYSRVDMSPTIVVRDRRGKILETLEKPDISRLLEYGWRMPERFKVKAADGKTDLYGIMWKPYDFDPSRKYPVISQVYPGPQTETVWTEFTVFDRYNNTALAQRGFIVVCMGHRGSSPLRGKRYYTFGHGNLLEYALEDDKCGLEQLGRRFDFIDTTRVGITGHSGGGMMALAALCTYPDFYKVAVASSGNHDNRIYNRDWGESFQGLNDDGSFSVRTNQELVKNMKGKLLLVIGEVDQNVHPAHTFRVVNQLIIYNKDFDLLVLPGQGHDYQDQYKSYYQRRVRDFFSTNL